ncbi:MAG: filamentous hemagglutinin N-terminal domain-containing protein, partial [Methylococcales bacterium]|nr:filamentous hemagglutinin N-terminal domain-containing protein [Methylococcales bacterium]
MVTFSQKPLILAIRTLIGSSFILGFTASHVRAGELPVPSAAVTLSANPVEIATQGHATAAISEQNMTIKQNSDKAVLNWQKFNVGVENSVKFEQPSSSAIALNNIHQADASKIMGTISANGQVYLVNQNGFIFGKDSQVNVNSLVATTLGISNDIFQKGITKAFDIDGSAALQGTGDVYLKDDKGNVLKDSANNPVKIRIIIAQGASIKTNAKNGRVIIAAPSITNEGDIETPDGQTILAASKDKVYLQEAGGDDSTRGLVVEVGKGGEVNNVGKVLAERGNASLLGFAVNQKGIVSATTSVKLNGSVRLLAHEGIQDRSGTGGKLLPQNTTRNEDEDDGLGKNATVNLSENSRTSVDLDSDKAETAIDAQAQTSSIIEVSGHDVVVQNNATIEAKSGNVAMTAVDNPTDNTQKGNARIYLESGSKIDVSGVKDVTLPVEHNVVNVEIRNNELRDAPLQRDGILHGKTVAVDVREANLKYDNTGKLTSASIPVTDIKGAVDKIARNIDERSTSGGKITLKSSGDVIAKTNSNLDFSGGSINYQDGVVETTQLTSNGQVFSISKADSNLNYDGIITNKVATSGYVEGKSGGALVINTYESVLDGDLHGETVSGIYQRDAANKVVGSSLSLDLNNNNSFGKQAIDFVTQSNATVISEKELLLRKSKEDSSAVDLVVAANTFQKAGITTVDIKTNGAITVEKDAAINLPNNGSLKIAAKDFDIQGSIISPSGNVDFQPIKIDGNRLQSTITLGDSAIIDTSGKWINDLADNQNSKTPSELTLDGGSVSLQSEQADLRLATGSRIDVSGGATIDINNKTTVGKAGAINLVATSHDAGGQAASLVLQGKLEGWGVKQGGTLNLTSNEVIISSSASTFPPSKRGAGGISKTQPLILNPDFFRQNGFSNYTVNSYLYGLTVADNVQIKPQQQNIQLNSNAATKPTGTNLRDVGTVITLPDEVRNPTNLTLSFAQPLAQNHVEVLTVGKNALIQGDTQATINLNSDTSIILNGKIDAPAGNINLTITTPTGGDTGFFDSQGIWLSSDSRLSAKGIFKPTFNALNLTTGDVLAGGNIALTAKRGYIVSRSQSVIDVSGTEKILDFVQSDNSNPQWVSQKIPSTGGSITLKAGEGIIADGNLQAKGGEGTAGGSLVVELNSSLRNKPDVPVSSGLFPDDENNALARTIEITNTITPALSNTVKQGDSIASEIYSGHALFKNEQLNQANFASLELKTDVIGASGDYAGGILFNGDITLNAVKQILLDTPQIQTIKGNVFLNTAYAALGSTQSRLDTDLGNGTFSTTLAPQAVNGQGQLNVLAKNIDLIGGLSFKNFNHVNLNSAGDLRTVGIRVRSDSKDYLGEFKLDGNLTLTATQIYPATLSNYKFSIAGENSLVTILPPSERGVGGISPTPIYSAAGNLTFDAANITQSGVLKAPFGSLNLNAHNQLRLTDGSVTSVSGDGVTVPFGRGSGGSNWLYPFDTNGSVSLVIDTPPEKRLTLAGREVDLQKGAKVNLNGGGDLYAYEFISGQGGMQDVLENNTTGNSKKFAVLPDLGHALT